MDIISKFKKKGFKETFSAGLDIGTSAIKLIKLRFIQETVELCAFNVEPIHLDIVSVLKKISDPYGVTKVNISVSGPSSIIRYVNFPKMKEEELKGALKFEAQKNIPFSIDEVNVDGCILKDNLPDNKMLVMLAAAKKDFISQRLKVVQETGLKVDIIDMDSIALTNTFLFNYPEASNIDHKAIALLNLGASVSNLNILEDGTPCLSRDIHIAGNNFTQKIAEIFGLDFSSAENIKLNPDKERVDKITSAIESVLANLSAEIRISFDYYESQSASSVVKIFLSGGSSQFSGVKDMLANLLGIEVECWDPLKRIDIPNNIDAQKLKTLAGQLPVVVGLALRK